MSFDCAFKREIGILCAIVGKHCYIKIEIGVYCFILKSGELNLLPL